MSITHDRQIYKSRIPELSAEQRKEAVEALREDAGIIKVQDAVDVALGCLPAGKMVRQLLHLDGKGHLPDGWVYKAEREWAEIGLSRSNVRTGTSKLVKAGLLRTASHTRNDGHGVNAFQLDPWELVRLLDNSDPAYWRKRDAASEPNPDNPFADCPDTTNAPFVDADEPDPDEDNAPGGEDSMDWLPDDFEGETTRSESNHTRSESDITMSDLNITMSKSDQMRSEIASLHKSTHRDTPEENDSYSTLSSSYRTLKSADEPISDDVHPEEPDESGANSAPSHPRLPDSPDGSLAHEEFNLKGLVREHDEDEQPVEDRATATTDSPGAGGHTEGTKANVVQMHPTPRTAGPLPEGSRTLRGLVERLAEGVESEALIEETAAEYGMDRAIIEGYVQQAVKVAGAKSGTEAA